MKRRILKAFSAQEAVNLFIESYVHLESVVLPGTQLIRVGGLPCVRFPDRQGKISHEIIAHGVSPAEIAARIQAYSPGLSHWLTLLTDAPQVTCLHWSARVTVCARAK
jgi:hypothetical protein